MLRITLMEHTPDEAILKVEGSISEEYVQVLEEEGNRWLGKTRSLALDLEGVRFIDHSGLALLQSWSDRIILHGAQQFIHMLLEAYGLDSAVSTDTEDWFEMQASGS